MLHKKKGAIEWLEFELFAADPRLIHAIFLRHGGVSSASFASLNLMGKGDDSHNAAENRRRIADLLMLKNIVAGNQVHGMQVEEIGAALKQSPTCDGLITNQKNLGLMALHADCQAAIFYDPRHQAIATAHAGWRGQSLNIYGQVIEKMRQAYGTNPKDLLVGISPSLGPEHSEFKNYRSELPESFWKFQVRPTFFDLWSIAHDQLLQSGILPAHIEIAKIDTYGNERDFFSYRRHCHHGLSENGPGRHGTVVALKC